MTPRVPSLVRGTVHHERRTPWRHGLHFRTYQWLIDVDTPPRIRGLASFPVRDHFAGNAASLRAAATAFAEAQGEQVQQGDRILMLASARSAGHVFDPLTVFWCLDAGGGLRWAILEIHNTYGDRHAHLVHPDADGRASIAKAFYVSPFFPVDGRYDALLRLQDERVAVAIRLVREGETAFTASFVGTPVPVTRSNLVRAFLRTPFATWQTTIRIRIHGIWLWLRRLPVIHRPAHPMQAGFQ